MNIVYLAKAEMYFIMTILSSFEQQPVWLRQYAMTKSMQFLRKVALFFPSFSYTSQCAAFFAHFAFVIAHLTLY